MKKKTIAALLAVTVFATWYGCNGADTPPEYEVNVWTATSAEKLMRDVDYSARYGAKTLTIDAFRNEYESAQILIIPKTDAPTNCGSGY
jgi:hypothetical protein